MSMKTKNTLVGAVIAAVLLAIVIFMVRSVTTPTADMTSDAPPDRHVSVIVNDADGKPVTGAESMERSYADVLDNDDVDAAMDVVEFEDAGLDDVADGRWYVVQSAEKDGDEIAVKLVRGSDAYRLRLNLDDGAVVIDDGVASLGVPGMFTALDVTGYGVDWQIVTDGILASTLLDGESTGVTVTETESDNG